MPFANTVDSGQVQPWTLGVDDIEYSESSNSNLGAGAAYLSGVTLRASILVTAFRCHIGTVPTPTGNVDMGIYDSNLNLLVHTGATAAASGILTVTLTTPYPLAPGNYWLAWLDTVSDSVYCVESNLTGLMVTARSVATGMSVLPGTLSGATQPTIARIAMLALRQGGFS